MYIDQEWQDPGKSSWKSWRNYSLQKMVSNIPIANSENQIHLGGMINFVYTINGHAITNFDQLKAGETYIVATEYDVDDARENHHHR